MTDTIKEEKFEDIKTDNIYAKDLPKNLYELDLMPKTVEYEQYGASTKVLSIMIQQLGLKYVGVKLEVGQELSFAQDNMNDLTKEFTPAVINSALRITHESKGNPTYFETKHIEPSMQRPVNIINNIVTRKEEATKKMRQLGELMDNIRTLKDIRRKRSPYYFIIDAIHKIIYR